MLGLRQHVRGQMLGIGVLSDDHNFGGAGDEIDAYFSGQRLLGRGDVDVSRSDDAIDLGDGGGAERQRRDGLRATDAEHVCRG